MNENKTVEQLAEDQYGNDKHLYAQQRDGFKVGYAAALNASREELARVKDERDRAYSELDKCSDMNFKQKYKLECLIEDIAELKEAQRWVPVSVTPDPDKYYQLAFNDDVYLDFFQWRLLDLSRSLTPCFVSVNGNNVMENYEVSHYREINTDGPDWTSALLNPN